MAGEQALGAELVLRSGEVGGDRVGGVAVQAVPGVVVPASGAGVLVPGVVLHVAQGRTGVEGEGDRRVPQAVRRQLVPGLDAPVAGQAAHQIPQVALPEAAAAGGGQQRPGQLPRVAGPAAAGPVAR